ncbi:MAG TPA: hypothetical protein ENK32_05520, partial [Anaerolineae bacterium]|nr:hypothetical protein [Anaerolineae bacterium]
DEAQQNLFFGRERLETAMITALENGRSLAIVGPSGSGKSSLARAGLIPLLKEGALPGSETWRYYPRLVPGRNPLRHLARALQPEFAPPIWVQGTVQNFRDSADSLTDLINQQTGGETAVLLIDQFEEIFTLCTDETIRRAFVNNLVNLFRNENHGHIVVITMRSDYESRLVRLGDFQALYEEALVRVPAMNAAELRQAIEKPAEAVGLKFEDGLVEQLIQDVLGEPAALPLLQFTLLQLWARRQRNQLTWTAYEELGGAQQALAAIADALYENLSPAEQRISRRIFLALVQPDPAADVTSRRVQRETLYQTGDDPQLVDAVLERFIDARLIRLTPGDTREKDRLEIGHIVLARNWPRLLGWLEEDRVTRRRRLRLRAMAEQWDATNRDPGALLRGQLLAEARTYNDLDELESLFVARSIEAAETEEREKEAARQRELEMTRRSARRLFLLVIGLTLATIITLAALIMASRSASLAKASQATAEANEAIAEAAQQTAEAGATAIAQSAATAAAAKSVAETAEAIAEAERDAAQQSAAEAATAQAIAINSARLANLSARVATARELSAAALDQLDNDPQLALLLSVEAILIFPEDDQSPPPEATDALYRALRASQQDVTLAGHTDWVTAVAFSPDGQLVATAGLDNSIKIWDAATGQLRHDLTEHTATVNDLAFSPDGRHLASASDDGLILVWDTAAGTVVWALQGEDDGAARSVAYHPDGKRLAAGYERGVARLWQIQPRQSLLRRTDFAGPVNDVAFNADGSQFAAGGDDGLVILYDTETGAPVTSVEPGSNTPAVYGIAINPQNGDLAVAYADNNVKIWREGLPALTLAGHSGFVFGAAYSPDGARLVTAGGDGAAKVWDAAAGDLISTLAGHNGPVTAVTYDNDGQRIATASQDGTAKIWIARASLEPRVLSGHNDAVLALAYSPDGRFLASGGADNDAILWDAASGEQVSVFSRHDNVVNDVAFSPDGTLLATGSEDSNVRLWLLESEGLQAVFDEAAAVSSTAFSPDGAVLAVGTADGIALWDVAAEEVTLTLSQSEAVRDLAFNPDGRLLAAAGDTAVTLWDTASGNVLNIIQGHEGPINGLAFSRDGAYLATASDDGTARIWQVPSGELVHSFAGHNGAALDVAFNGDSSRLATGGVDKTARLWDAATGRILRTIQGHTAAVTAVAFSPDGKFLTTASKDSAIQINPLNTLDELLSQAGKQLIRGLTAAECLQFRHGETCLTETEDGSPPANIAPSR